MSAVSAIVMILTKQKHNAKMWEMAKRLRLVIFASRWC